MAVIGGIDPTTHEPKAVWLTPDGALPVSEVDADGPGIEGLLIRLIWEVAALRKVYCDDTDQLFEEYEI